MEEFRKENRLFIAAKDNRLVEVSCKYYRKKGYITDGCTTPDRIFEKIRFFKPQVILLSVDFDKGINVNNLIRRIKDIEKDCNILFFAREEDSEIIKEAWRSGAFFFLKQGARPKEIIPEIERAFEDYFSRVEIRFMKNFVFVLMPFSESFDDIYDLGIKSAVEECNLFCQRVDEQHFTNSVLENIIHNIKRARFIIADMTEKSPNVYYEVGYAEALGKPIICISQDNSEAIPFDLNQKPHILYQGKITFLKEKLKDRLMGLIEQRVGLH